MQQSSAPAVLLALRRSTLPGEEASAAPHLRTWAAGAPGPCGSRRTARSSALGMRRRRVEYAPVKPAL